MSAEDDTSHVCRPQHVALAWAMSVRVSELGGTLQALAETVPVSNTLKLCHRFGKGPNAYVTKLSPELILVIIDHLVQPTITSTVKKWDRDLRCFESRCVRKDHITSAVHHSAKAKLRIKNRTSASDIHKAKLKTRSRRTRMDDSWNEGLQELLDEELDMHAAEVHIGRIKDCKARIVQLTSIMDSHPVNPRNKKFSLNLLKGLERYFGLSALITEKNSCTMLTHSLGYLLRTFVCHITLPMDWTHKSSRDGNKYHSMHGIVDPAALLLSESNKDKLAESMRKLQLKPYVHPVQVNLDHAHPLYEKKFQSSCIHRVPVSGLEELLVEAANEHTASTWPKLINRIPEAHSFPVQICPCGECEAFHDEEDDEEDSIDWESHKPHVPF